MSLINFVETADPGVAEAANLPQECPFRPSALNLRILPGWKYTFIPRNFRTETTEHGLKKCRSTFERIKLGDTAGGDSEKISDVCFGCLIRTKGIR